jgi:cholesterol transport system auxiliary component
MRGIAVLAATTLASGCALTSRGENIRWQYFTPEHVRPGTEVTNVGAGPDLCIGRISSGAGLTRRIAHTNGGVEVGYYEDRRWTDEPENYVRRALERTLFQEHNLRCDRDTSAARLDVEVLRFEELRSPAGHAARVAVRVVLRTPEERAILDETIQVVDPVEGASFDAVVVATGRALDGASAEIARRTSAALGS